MVILQLIHDLQPNLQDGLLLLVKYRHMFTCTVITHNNGLDRIAIAFGGLLMFLTYQLLTVGCLLTVAMTGDGGLGFDSGEGA